MRKQGSPEPFSIAISTALYRLMLAFYPPGFRKSYGAQMAQLFRDSCISAYGGSRAAGVIGLWGRIIFDWVQTVLEEWSQIETEITRRKFIRLGGWALMLGGISLGLGLFVRLDWIRLMLYRTMGPPTTLEEYNHYRAIAENIGEMPGLAGLLLVLVGIYGLRLCYQEKLDRNGQAFLDFSLLGGMLAIGALLLMADTDNGWWVLVTGFVIMFGCLALFGLVAGRTGFLRPFQASLLLSWLWFPLWIDLSLALEYLSGGNWVEIPGWVEMPFWIVSLAALVLLGHALQGENRSPVVAAG